MSDAAHEATPAAEVLWRAVAVLGAIAAAACVYFGWRSFWFLTDDAFIAFRYVSNSMLGHGWVWNPPPFLPVEGYTSFLWVLLLDVVWRVTGTLPPDSANWLSLGFGYATLYVGYRFAKGMTLPPSHERLRWPLFALVVLGTVSNRTFLAWLSSGLETSLFIFLLSCWILFASGSGSGSGSGSRSDSARAGALSLRARTLGATASAAALTLTRPDGLLFCVATLPLVWPCVSSTGGARDWPRLAWAAPLLAVPIHLLWRFSSYGMWLPNTYYAKVTAVWPSAGMRYLACFVLEYGLWMWLVLGGAALWASARRTRDSGAGVEGAEAPRSVGGSHANRWIVCSALFLHVAYYTLVVGGDHFEYRVYSYLIFWLFLSGAWLVARAGLRPVSSLALLAVFVLASWPIPWLHWSETRGLETRAETRRLSVPIADHFPPGLRAVVAQWDEWQAWLIRRSIGSRHQEHKIAYEAGAMFWPPREEGAKIAWQERAVLAIGGVGAAAWSLPNVAIIDKFGLNDRVIARNPTPALAAQRVRVMAHERRPPKGYVACFLPNVLQPYIASPRCGEELMKRPVGEGRIGQGVARNAVEVHRIEPPIGDADFASCDRLIVLERAAALSDERIRGCERGAWR